MGSPKLYWYFDSHLFLFGKDGKKPVDEDVIS